MLNQIRNKFTVNLSMKFLSFLISVVLWFAVLGSRNVEITKDIPIEVVTPQDLAVSSDIPDKVAFRMSGPKAFLRTVLNRKEEPIRVNFSNALPGITTYRFFQDNIQVPIGVKVLSVNPAAIVVKLEPIKRKEVPLKLVLRGETDPGYTLVKADLSVKTVKIKGPESKIELISELNTTPVNLKELHDSGEKNISIDISSNSGVAMDGESPKLSFVVNQATSNFKIRNVEVKVLSSRKFKADPKEVNVFVKCNPEELKSLNRSKVSAVVDVKSSGVGTHEETVDVQLPPTIKLIKVVPAKIKVTLY